MRGRHKQGRFLPSEICLDCTWVVCFFSALSRDCARLWLIASCHRVNSNFNLSHVVIPGLWRTFLQTLNTNCNFVLFNFLGALPTNRMHSMWEFVFVAQFLRVFQGKFGFVNFTTEVGAHQKSKSSLKLSELTQLSLFLVSPKRGVLNDIYFDNIFIKGRRNFNLSVCYFESLRLSFKLIWSPSD